MGCARAGIAGKLHAMDDHSHKSATPDAVAYVRDLLAGFGAAWFLCGGWAADAWLGRQTRDHFDVDVSVLHHDQRAIFEHFPGWALVGHDPNVPDATTEPWNGRHLDLPAHVHVPRFGTELSTSPTATHPEFEFEFLLNAGSDGHCVLHPELDVAVPLERCLQPSGWGLPTAAAEVVLFFKAGGDLSLTQIQAADRLYRDRDEQDFFALLPTLSEAQRSWLRDSVGRIRPTHPWLAHLQP